MYHPAFIFIRLAWMMAMQICWQQQWAETFLKVLFRRVVPYFLHSSSDQDLGTGIRHCSLLSVPHSNQEEDLYLQLHREYEATMPLGLFFWPSTQPQHIAESSRIALGQIWDQLLSSLLHACCFLSSKVELHDRRMVAALHGAGTQRVAHHTLAAMQS